MPEVGRRHLQLLAAFLRQVPCQVLIGNSVSSGATETYRGRELDRPFAILTYLCQQQRIPPGWIALKDCTSEVADNAGHEGVIEITLLAEEGRQ